VERGFRWFGRMVKGMGSIVSLGIGTELKGKGRMGEYLLDTIIFGWRCNALGGPPAMSKVGVRHW